MGLTHTAGRLWVAESTFPLSPLLRGAAAPGGKLVVLPGDGSMAASRLEGLQSPGASLGPSLSPWGLGALWTCCAPDHGHIATLQPRDLAAVFVSH